ncbi:MAG: hypothetical protein KGL59_11455 [Acidobacteriota bacterium]|nr:hypothetical protein [Acidobacteriota bacterium]
MKQTATPPTQSQRTLLEALADGAIIAVVHTRGGTIASLFPKEGRHRNISYKVVQPMVEAAWIEDVVPKPLRWRGSKYVISAKGRQMIGSESSSRASVRGLTPSEVAVR